VHLYLKSFTSSLRAHLECWHLSVASCCGKDAVSKQCYDKRGAQGSAAHCDLVLLPYLYCKQQEAQQQRASLPVDSPMRKKVGWLSFAASKCFMRHMDSGRAKAQKFIWILCPRPRARVPMGEPCLRLPVLPDKPKHFACESLSQDSLFPACQVAAATALGGGT